MEKGSDGRMRWRERESSNHCFILQMVQLAGLHGVKPRNGNLIPLIAGSHAPGPLSTAFPSTITGRWIKS